MKTKLNFYSVYENIIKESNYVESILSNQMAFIPTNSGFVDSMSINNAMLQNIKQDNIYLDFDKIKLQMRLDADSIGYGQYLKIPRFSYDKNRNTMMPDRNGHYCKYMDVYNLLKEM